MERPDYWSTEAWPRNPCHRTDRLLIEIPVVATVGITVAATLGRFIWLLRENLKENPASLPEILLLALIVGSIGVLAALVAAAVGLSIGFVLRAVVTKWRDRAILKYERPRLAAGR